MRHSEQPPIDYPLAAVFSPPLLVAEVSRISSGKRLLSEIWDNGLDYRQIRGAGRRRQFINVMSRLRNAADESPAKSQLAAIQNFESAALRLLCSEYPEYKVPSSGVARPAHLAAIHGLSRQAVSRHLREVALRIRSDPGASPALQWFAHNSIPSPSEWIATGGKHAFITTIAQMALEHLPEKQVQVPWRRQLRAKTLLRLLHRNYGRIPIGEAARELSYTGLSRHDFRCALLEISGVEILNRADGEWVCVRPRDPAAHYVLEILRGMPNPIPLEEITPLIQQVRPEIKPSAVSKACSRHNGIFRMGGGLFGERQHMEEHLSTYQVLREKLAQALAPGAILCFEECAALFRGILPKPLHTRLGKEEIANIIWGDERLEYLPRKGVKRTAF